MTEEEVPPAAATDKCSLAISQKDDEQVEKEDEQRSLRFPPLPRLRWNWYERCPRYGITKYDHGVSLLRLLT